MLLSMKTQDVKKETSGSSDSCLPLKKRMRPTPDDTKYKGVVMQHNGHWGAQIYINHRRIWLGTFKTAVEAARNYDSASIKLRSFDPNSYRNFPWDDLTVHEPTFQQSYTTEAVLNMIKDGSYKQKFRDFVNRIRSQNVEGSKQSGVDEESNKGFSCVQIFQKELTLSDVGKLNRLVIPKKYAVKYLPSISEDRGEREEGEIREDMEEVEVVFYDRAMRQWKFRYCFWSSSQSYVFTRGWIGFVKDKKLKEKDVIVFYTCNVNTIEGTSKNFVMVDVHNYSDNGLMVPNEEVDVRVHESSDPIEIKTGSVVSSKLEDEETKSEEKKGGFMLFGVRIQ